MTRKRMHIIDISWPISAEMTGYKNRKEFSRTWTKEFVPDGAWESKISIGSHAGTHVDAPLHFLPQGRSLEKGDLSCLVGQGRVLDCTHVQEKITAADLEKFAIQKDEIILLKTSNSFLDAQAPFNTAFVYLEKSGAEFLAQKAIKAVGIDYLGIERNQPNHETHSTLFAHDILIVEGLRLAPAAQGNYFVCCLPLAVQGAEAAPARAILIKF